MSRSLFQPNKIKNACCLLLLLLLSTPIKAQMEQYDYRRELSGITDLWHRIILPEELFDKSEEDLADIRIYGITSDNDTIEAPYLIRKTAALEQQKEVAFKLINSSHNDRGAFFTFELSTSTPINKITTSFKQPNYDWIASVEGSNDQNEWFTLVNNYRILSLHNDQIDFQFNKIIFPPSNYHFFRLQIHTTQKVELERANICLEERSNASYRAVSISHTEISTDKKKKQTTIDLDLDQNVPVSYVRLHIKDQVDYYRKATIEAFVDSVKTEKGWIHQYEQVATETVNSLDINRFTFNSVTAPKLRIIIYNQDNQPLKIDHIELKGYIYNLEARFSELATYYLTYGNKDARHPRYDIEQFTNKIPKQLTPLQIGEEQRIEKEEPSAIMPLFQDERWLWGIILLIIAVIAWFTVKMIKTK